jgi:hypothetical protein
LIYRAHVVWFCTLVIILNLSLCLFL